MPLFIVTRLTSGMNQESVANLTAREYTVKGMPKFDGMIFGFPMAMDQVCVCMSIKSVAVNGVNSIPNALVVRMGGDEILILRVGNCSVQELEQGVQRVLDRLRSTYAATEKLRILSASVGITQSHGSQEDIDILLQQSDIGLDQAKQNGRGRCWVYDQEEG